MFVRAVGDMRYYDGNYTYSFACLWNDEDCNKQLSEVAVTDLTEQEKQYIQNVIWMHIDIKAYINLHIEDKLNVTHPDDRYEVFCGNTIIKDMGETANYNSMWLSTTDKSKGLMVTVNYCHSGEIADIKLNPVTIGA